MANGQDAVRRYAAVARALSGQPRVQAGPGGGRFGSAGLQVDGHIFAMVSSKGEYVVKLPRARVDALVAAGAGHRFDPGHGRIMKEWLALDPGADQDWLGLAREALAFVGGARP